MGRVGNLSHAAAVQIPDKLANVPPFPSVAMKLMSLLANEDTNFSDIASCIGTDPALAGRLIKRANAADLASYCEARNVLQAISALGMERTRELSLTIATHGYAQSAIKAEVLRPCWSHTVACALAASEIARQCGLRPAEAYTAGLLHDIGRLGLMTAYPAEYEVILTQVGGEPGRLIDLERERFGADHLQAGEWLAHEWNLPESIAGIIARHAETPSRPLDETAVVQIAARLADLLGFAVIPSEEVPDLDQIAAILPESARARLRAQLPTLREAIRRELQLSEKTQEPEAAETEAEEPVDEIAAPTVADETSNWLLIAVTVAVLLAAIAFYLRR